MTKAPHPVGTAFFERRDLVARTMTVAILLVASASPLWADGKVVPLRDYQGSLEEQAQEAIIIFHSADAPGRATEDLILKIHVAGLARQFAWIVPFPKEPKVTKEDPRLFHELFDYVEARQHRSAKGEGSHEEGPGSLAATDERRPVEVLSRKTVGDFDVAIVRENEQGGLNPWLEREGYQTLDAAEDVLDFYRQKNYVYACIKVSSDALASQRSVQSHPLRFTFATGGRDGIYFPMKLTGLQTQPFDVNLYVFYRFWINDNLSKYGYRHRGFQLRYRDWDTRECVPNGGKAYSLPEEDPFLNHMSHRIETVRRLFQKLHPGEKYYLTNIQARQMKPEDVRQWPDDLWLFPYYTNRNMVPFDAREGGPAGAAWPAVNDPATGPARRDTTVTRDAGAPLPAVLVLAVLALAVLAATQYWRNRRRPGAGLPSK